MRDVKTEPKVRQSFLWLGQAISGVLLIVILLLHMIFQHFQEGLLSAEAIVAHVSRPAIFALEILFVLVVTYHALAGVRAIVFDLKLEEKARHRIGRGLTLIGLITAVYGVVLAYLIRAGG